MDEIEIPTHFLCPISLQLMKDPVILSTGITYDRDCIEKWLFSSKNNTCPVTKQFLSSSDSDLIPNHTLRRLIQSWCTLNSSHGIERIPTPKPPISITEIIKLLKEAETAKSTEMQLRSLTKLKSISMESGRNRISLESAGATQFLISVIETSNDFSLIEESLSILHQLKISGSGSFLKNFISNDTGFFGSVIRILKFGSYQSRAYATMLLKSALEIADPVQLISIRSEFLAEIVRVLRDQISNQASKAALKILVELCPWGRNRVKVVEGGAVMVILDLLLETSEKRDCELMMILLDQICGCAEGRAELVNHAAGLAVVSKKILRVSHLVSDRAVRILSSICKFSGTVKVVREMVEVGVVAKLCLVLQVDCGDKTKERAREILRMHSRVWRSSSCVPSHLLDSFPASP